MSSLDYPKKGESITAWLRKLYFFVKTLELRGDGKTCRIDHTAAGSVLHILPQSGGSSGGGAVIYLGPFRIGYSGEKVEIQHGGYPTADFAGLANINGDLLKVPTGSISAGVGFVLLKATENGGRITFSWHISGTLPTVKNGENIGYAVIGEINTLNSGTQVIVQYQNSCPTILIGEECRSDQSSQK